MLLIMIFYGENYLSARQSFIFHDVTFMTFNNFPLLYLASSDFEYRKYQHQSFQLMSLHQVLFQSLSQKNLCQQLAHPQKFHSWNFLSHMLFSNLNYRQINFFLFDSDYHLSFKTNVKMDFVAGLEFMNFFHHHPEHFHYLDSVQLIFKGTFMLVQELTMAQSFHVNYFNLTVIVIKVSRSLLDLMVINFSYFRLFFFTLHLILFQKKFLKFFKFTSQQLKNLCHLHYFFEQIIFQTFSSLKNQTDHSLRQN